MDIIVSINNIDIRIIRRFLESFSANCIDKKNVNIYLVTRDESVLTSVTFSDIHSSTNIKYILISDLIKEYSCDSINSQHLIHLLAIINKSHDLSQYVCVLPTNIIFIRKFLLKKYIDNYSTQYYYCSKSSNIFPLPDDIISRNECVDSSDIIWYNEVPTYIFDKRVVCDLYTFMIEKYKSIKNIPDFSFEQCYYVFYKKYQSNKNYPKVSWVDSYELLKFTLSSQSQQQLELMSSLSDSDTPLASLESKATTSGPNSWCFTSESSTPERDSPSRHFSQDEKFAPEKAKISIIEQALNLIETSYVNMSTALNIYTTLNIKTFHFNNKNINNILFMLINKEIFFCLCDYWNIIEKLMSNNVFNLNIAIGVSGLVRIVDNINILYNFLQLCPYDTFFYITTENKHLPKENNVCIKKFVIDNTRIYQNVIAKYKQPHTKDSMVINTCEMTYKKQRLCDYINQFDTYDIIVNIRPDLLSMDGQFMMHIILKVLLKYQHNTLYIPKIYNSLGITDTIAIGDKNVMTKYLHIHEHINTFLSSYYFNPEYLFYKYITGNGITIDVFDWIYKIFWHHPDALTYWWRYEFDIEKYVREYLKTKVMSLETLVNMNSVQNEKKYLICHKQTGQYLNICNGQLQINRKRNTKFQIHQHHDKIIRCYIRAFPEIIAFKKQFAVMSASSGSKVLSCFASDKESTEKLHDIVEITKLYKPTQNILTTSSKTNTLEFCDDMNLLQSQFYLLHVNDYFLIISTESHYLENRCGTFGRYIGVSDNMIITDMENCVEAQWSLQ